MSPLIDFGPTLDRISSAVSALRVRAEEQLRAQRNGIVNADQAEALSRLRGIADDLEKALA